MTSYCDTNDDVILWHKSNWSVPCDRLLAMGTPPSHCGIVGNELADQLAKQGAAEHQTENQVALHKQDPDQGRREAEAFSCFRSPAFHLESSSLV